MLADSKASETRPADQKPATQPAVTPNSVVFVIDATGSMINSMAAVKEGLATALAKLAKDEYFDIVVFRDVEVMQLEGGLQQATPRNIKLAIDFLAKVTATGTTDPLPAFRVAFNLLPERICVITDGADYPQGWVDLLHAIREVNPHRRTRLDFLIVSESKDREAAAADCKVLAKFNRGIFQVINSEGSIAAISLSRAIESPPQPPAMKADEPDPPDPRAEYFYPQDAATVVYVCDCSDSMKSQLENLKFAIKDWITRLKPKTRFNVVMFHTGDRLAFFGGPVPWDKLAAERTDVLLSRTHTDGTPDPREALRAAFAMKPDAIIFVGASDLGERYPIVDLVNKLNADRKVRVNFVALKDRNDRRSGSRLLGDLAKQNGGVSFPVAEEPTTRESH